MFDDLKGVGLPIGEYLVTGSGPLGVKGIRSVNDIDIVVTRRLWAYLESKYEARIEDGLKKIAIPNTCIEVLGEGSAYYSSENDIKSRIEQAEIIDGFPFERLEKVINIKKQIGRKKDLADVKLIQEYLCK